MRLLLNMFVICQICASYSTLTKKVLKKCYRNLVETFHIPSEFRLFPVMVYRTAIMIQLLQPLELL